VFENLVGYSTKIDPAKLNACSARCRRVSAVRVSDIGQAITDANQALLQLNSP